MYERESKIGKTHKVNFRPLFYGFLAFAIGIAFTYYLITLNVTFIVLFGIGLGLTIGFAIFKKKFVNLIVILMCLLAGVGAYFIDAGNFTKQKYGGEICEVQGKVSTNIYDKEDYVYAVLHNVKINGKPSNNLSVSITKLADFELENGMVLNFKTEVYDEPLFENGTFNSFAYKMKAPQNCYIVSNNVSIIAEGELSIAEKVRNHTKNLLYSFMPEKIAELSYSILFGDQVDLDEDIKNSFATSGLGHLVAVSGLNTAVLIACLYWILKKLHCTGLPRFIIVGVILLIYCYLCSFTPSVVRASVMSLVFLASGLFGRQYDLISSVGVAGIIILLFNPFSVYDIGFLLSFVSVIAIGFLANPLTKFFSKKCKFPKFIAEAVAIDLCTTIAISPIIAVYFGKISLFSPISNLICVPLFSFAYICIFALVFVVSIFGFMGFLFWVPSIILQFIIWFAGVIASFEWALVMLYSLSIIGVVAFYISVFCFSKMFMDKTFSRFGIASLAIVSAVMLSSLLNFSVAPKENSYAQLNTSNPCIVLTSSSGKVLVVGNQNLVFLDEYLTYHHINYVNTLVETAKTDSRDFINKYNVQNIITFTNGSEFVDDFEIIFIYQNSIKKAIYVEVDNVGVVVGLDNIGTSQAKNISDILKNKNVKAVYEKRTTLHFTNLDNFEYVFSNNKVDCENNFATKVFGSFTFNIKNGIMQEIRSID